MSIRLTFIPNRQRTATNSATDDEKAISRDIRGLRPFKKEDGRSFESFASISCNPTHSLDKDKFATWINRHKKNILMHYPVSEDAELCQTSDLSYHRTVSNLAISNKYSTVLVL